MEEKVSDAATTVKEEILAGGEGASKFVAALQQHFTKVGLHRAHGTIGVLAGFMLADGFGDWKGGCSGNDGRIESWLDGRTKTWPLFSCW